MSIKVETEATRNRLLSTDQDKFRKRYQEKSEGFSITFASPYISVLEKYRFFLLKNSVKKVLESKYYYKPDYLSVKEYGTETLWYILLFINDIPCIEEFDKYEVYIPTFGALLELAKYDVSKDVTLIRKSDAVSKELLDLYSSKIVPNTNPSTPEEPVESQALYWVRQRFDISSSHQVNGYVDLAYEAISDTVSVKIEHGGNFVYNVDYALIKSFDDLYRRISWRDEDCGEGPGLIGSIREGMMLEVQYAKKKDA